MNSIHQSTLPPMKWVISGFSFFNSEVSRCKQFSSLGFEFQIQNQNQGLSLPIMPLNPLPSSPLPLICKSGKYCFFMFAFLLSLFFLCSTFLNVRTEHLYSWYFGQETFVERLYCEIHQLKTLKHNNIIKFYTSWVDFANRNMNFVTEMFTYGTLRQ